MRKTIAAWALCLAPCLFFLWAISSTDHCFAPEADPHPQTGVCSILR